MDRAWSAGSAEIKAVEAPARASRPALFNLRSDPEVEIQIGRERREAGAQILGPADADYERLWKIVDQANHERYSAYQEQTERPIPIVVVTPG